MLSDLEKEVLWDCCDQAIEDSLGARLTRFTYWQWSPARNDAARRLEAKGLLVTLFAGIRPVFIPLPLASWVESDLAQHPPPAA